MNYVQRHLGHIAPRGVADRPKATAKRLTGWGREVASLFEERLEPTPYARGLVLPCLLTGASALLAGVLVGGALTSGGGPVGTAIEQVVYPQTTVASAAQVPRLGTRKDPSGHTDAAGFVATLVTPGFHGVAQVSNNASGDPAAGPTDPPAPRRHAGPGKAPPRTTKPAPPSTPTRTSKHHQPDKRHDSGEPHQPGRPHHSEKHHHPAKHQHPAKHHPARHHPAKHHPQKHHRPDSHHHPDKRHHHATRHHPGREHQP